MSRANAAINGSTGAIGMLKSALVEYSHVRTHHQHKLKKDVPFLQIFFLLPHESWEVGLSENKVHHDYFTTPFYFLIILDKRQISKCKEKKYSALKSIKKPLNKYGATFLSYVLRDHQADLPRLCYDGGPPELPAQTHKKKEKKEIKK